MCMTVSLSVVGGEKKDVVTLNLPTESLSLSLSLSLLYYVSFVARGNDPFETPVF